MGTSGTRADNEAQGGDHPHAYGDKYQGTGGVICEAGSSPRVWGQVTTNINKVTQDRIIPTRMGTRLNAIRNSASQKDHPHAYGDKLAL